MNALMLCVRIYEAQGSCQFTHKLIYCENVVG
jgi:hypothetical protein